MLKLRIGRHRSPNLIVLGLSEANVERLKQGKPVLVRGTEVGLAPDIVIAYGATEQVIAQDLRDAGLKIPEFPDPEPSR